MSLSGSQKYLALPFWPFPAPHKCSPFEIPRVRGGMKTGKKGSSRMLSCISELSYYSQTGIHICGFVKLQLRLYPQYRNNFRSLNPIHQHGIQWRTSPSPDRLRPLGRQGRYRNWYANLSLPLHISPCSPPAKFHSVSEQAPHPALASQ